MKVLRLKTKNGSISWNLLKLQDFTGHGVNRSRWRIKPLFRGHWYLHLRFKYNGGKYNVPVPWYISKISVTFNHFCHAIDLFQFILIFCTERVSLHKQTIILFPFLSMSDLQINELYVKRPSWVHCCTRETFIQRGKKARVKIMAPVINSQTKMVLPSFRSALGKILRFGAFHSCLKM